MIAFGKAKWVEYYGDIGDEPPLPDNIEKILYAPCPFWSHKRVRETHLLVLIPNAIDGKLLTFNSLEEVVQNPKKGNKAGYSLGYRNIYNKYIEKGAGDISAKTHWVLMTRKAVPNPPLREYSTQDNPLSFYIRESKHDQGYFYEIPTCLEAAVSIFTEYTQTGVNLYEKNSIICSEKVTCETTDYSFGGNKEVLREKNLSVGFFKGKAFLTGGKLF